MHRPAPSRRAGERFGCSHLWDVPSAIGRRRNARKPQRLRPHTSAMAQSAPSTTKDSSCSPIMPLKDVCLHERAATGQPLICSYLSTSVQSLGRLPKSASPGSRTADGALGVIRVAQEARNSRSKQHLQHESTGRRFFTATSDITDQRARRTKAQAAHRRNRRSLTRFNRVRGREAHDRTETRGHDLAPFGLPRPYAWPS